MKQRILNYRMKIDAILDKDEPGTDWNEILEEHLVQVGFFQHERLIHLIVTVTFALLAIISLLLALLFPQISSYLLFVAVMVLLVPYISHYYLLENETQKMYGQYDRIVGHIREKKN